MPEYLAPGVYVEEVDTGSKPIEGVSTSTAGMVGVTERGPVERADLRHQLRRVPPLVRRAAERRPTFRATATCRTRSKVLHNGGQAAFSPGRAAAVGHRPSALCSTQQTDARSRGPARRRSRNCSARADVRGRRSGRRAERLACATAPGGCRVQATVRAPFRAPATASSARALPLGSALPRKRRCSTVRCHVPAAPAHALDGRRRARREHRVLRGATMAADRHSQDTVVRARDSDDWRRGVPIVATVTGDGALRRVALETCRCSRPSRARS